MLATISMERGGAKKRRGLKEKSSNENPLHISQNKREKRVAGGT